jgi:retron-type reverse transcriptase
MKLAEIIPLYKSGEHDEFGNYRPISLLMTLSKVLEKLVHNRTSKFLEDTKQITNLQHGFRKGHSTTTAAMSFIGDVIKNFEQGNFTLAFFIDLSKAFDTVSHHILLSKLNSYGIRGVANSWFKDYLCDRPMLVKVGDTKSDVKTVSHGVPQGSILGPLLFCIMINPPCTAYPASTDYNRISAQGYLN